MTTIRQLIQTSPSKAGELFAKLVDTSEGAVKTRDRLFCELKVELELQAELEEQHLFPVLKKHEGTKGLVAGALDDNRQTRRLLVELEHTPKDGEAFGAKVAELRKVFQQHVRDDKKEFLSAVVKALSDEEASAVVEKIEDGKAEIEAAHRADGEKRQAEAEREEAEAARQAKVERELEEAEATRQAAKATKAAAEAARSAQDEAGALIERIADKAEPARRADASERRPEAQHEVAEVILPWFGGRGRAAMRSMSAGERYPGAEWRRWVL